MQQDAEIQLSNYAFGEHCHLSSQALQTEYLISSINPIIEIFVKFIVIEIFVQNFMAVQIKT
jgi:hypothetical protein